MTMEAINDRIQSEHEDYIQLKTRVEIAVELMATDSYFNKENLLRVLGTEKAVKLADDLRKSDEGRRAKNLEKYSGAVGDAQM